jgi:hypothetical protein
MMSPLPPTNAWRFCEIPGGANIQDNSLSWGTCQYGAGNLVILRSAFCDEGSPFWPARRPFTPLNGSVQGDIR